jgi:signal transduction histidine kinase
MATKLRRYLKNGKADYVWNVDSLPWGTNELSRVKYGIYRPSANVAIGWAKLDERTVIGYRVPPFELKNSMALYLFVAGVAMVMLLFSTLFVGGMFLARAAKRAREDLAVKNSFLDVISHELNTPLGSIVPLSSALANDTIKDDSRKQIAIATISRESARMARMISELLTVVRLRNGKMFFSRTAFDVLEVAEHAASLVRARHPDCAIKVARGDSVVALADEIKQYVKSDAGKPSNFTSESFGGYSYSKATDNNGAPLSWEKVFAGRLNKYRRMSVL